jgi:hypothetical protein
VPLHDVQREVGQPQGCIEVMEGETIATFVPSLISLSDERRNVNIEFVEFDQALN